MNRLYLRAARAFFVGTLVFFVVIFLPAWTLHYWQGWTFFLTYTVLSLPTTIYLAIHDPKLLERRLRAGPKAEKTPTQKAITTLGLPLFFAATVDVAEGQTVVSTGPYAVVRHPMYSGAVLMLVWAPLALGSWWGLLFAPLFVGLLAWRLWDEEKFLRKNLPGYEAYTHQVRYRLVPFIW